MEQQRMMTASQRAVTSLLSAPRLASYEAVTGTTSEALRLSEWNMHAAAAALELTGIVEVVVRNALDGALTDWARARRAGRSWFDAVALDDKGRNDLDHARRRATRAGRRSEAHGRVVAELSFGFWRYLVESRYHSSLWVPDLHRAFPFGTTDLRERRTDVAHRMQQLHFLRNRAAHHEPIHQRDLRRDHAFAIELLGWVHPVAAEWATSVSTLPAVLADRPAAHRPRERPSPGA